MLHLVLRSFTVLSYSIIVSWTFPTSSFKLYYNKKLSQIPMLMKHISMAEFHCAKRTVFLLIYSRYCLQELSADSSPNSDTTNLYRSDKGIRGLGIASGNTSPAFQGKKTVFYQMAQFIEIFIIAALFFVVLLRWNHRLHSRRKRIGQDII